MSIVAKNHGSGVLKGSIGQSGIGTLELRNAAGIQSFRGAMNASGNIEGKNIMRISKLNGLKLLLAGVVFVCVVAPSALAQHVHLSWVAPPVPSCGPITSYNVYRSPAAGGEVIGTAGTKIGSSAASVLTYDDATVAYGQTYFYKVTSVANACSTSESVFSNETSGVIPAQVIIVQPPVQNPPQVVIP